MARPVWSGTLSFGLLNIPVSLMSGERRTDISFRMLDARNNAPIKYERVNAETGEEVPWKEIVKAYEYDKGSYVVLEPEDIKSAAPESHDAIEVEGFVDVDSIGPQYFEKPYVLVPAKKAEKGYVLLREALEKSGRVALVKIALRQRETLATLRVRDGVFVLEMMLWPDEIREPSFGFLDEDVDVRQQELAMAQSLIDTLSGDFKPEQYSDNYREALQALIEAKIAGREVVAPAEPVADSGTVVDLMAALRASVEAAKQGRGESAPAAAPAAKKKAAPAQKSAQKAAQKTAQKAPAKKATSKRASAGSAKKTTAKRANARKSA